MQPLTPLISAIEKYLAGRASAEEEQLVNEWYYSFDDSFVEMPEQIAELRIRVGMRIWNRLEQMMRKADQREEAGRVREMGDAGEEEEEGKLVVLRNQPRGPRRYFRRLAVAALVLLVLSAGFYQFLAHSKREPAPMVAVKKPANEIKPGGDKAILTLSDGSVIQLDSAQNGVLAKQGAARVLKLNNGQLAYDLSAANGRSGQQPVGYNTISTPKGGQFQITLPDGTQVWLNAASSIRFPTRFDGQERKIELKGEAYFEIAKNAAQPFRVDVPHHRAQPDTMHIRVLGTRFNVNSYEDEALIRTTLVEGTVRVEEGENKKLLEPGQQAQMDTRGGIRIQPDADIEEALAWKNGRFQYNSTGLQAIMRQLSRWYDVNVIYQGDLEGEFFSGSIPRTENVEQVLNMLAMTNTVRFTIKDRNIYVRPRR